MVPPCSTSQPTRHPVPSDKNSGVAPSQIPSKAPASKDPCNRHWPCTSGSSTPTNEKKWQPNHLCQFQKGATSPGSPLSGEGSRSLGRGRGRGRLGGSALGGSGSWPQKSCSTTKSVNQYMNESIHEQINVNVHEYEFSAMPYLLETNKNNRKSGAFGRSKNVSRWGVVRPGSTRLPAYLAHLRKSRTVARPLQASHSGPEGSHWHLKTFGRLHGVRRAAASLFDRWAPTSLLSV